MKLKIQIKDRFFSIFRNDIFLLKKDIPSSAFHVNNSAHATITNISQRLKVSQLRNFTIP